MSKRRSVRRSLAVLILLVILLGAAWTGLWYVVSGRLAHHVATWEQQEQAAGWTITHGEPRRTGWPMAAGVTLPSLFISGGKAYLHGGIAWHADSLTLALDIRHPNDLYFGVSGRQSLAVGSAPAIPFRTRRLTGRVTLLSGDRPGLIQLHATGLLAALPTAGGAPRPLSIADIAAALRADAAARASSDALILAATLSMIDLPPHLLPALGKLQNLSVDAVLSGPVPPAGNAPDPVATATVWRQAGGSLTLRTLHLLDGPLTLDGQGRFQLDPSLQPSGTLILRAIGLDPMLTRLAETGTLSCQEAKAAKAVLALMMRPPQPDVVTAPLSLHDGLVSFGAIPLIRLPL